MTDAAAFVALMRRCENSPADFNRRVLGRVHPSIPGGYWSKQVEVLEALLRHRKVAVPSGHGTGKSFLAAGAALHFCYTRPNSRVIVVAPSWKQLTDVLWAELAAAWKKSRVALPGRLLSGASLKLAITDTWGIWGTSADTSMESLAGRHAGDLLCVLDECSWDGYDQAIEVLESFNASHYLFIGNPLRHGKFHDLCEKADGIVTKRISISSLESPHIHLPRSPVGLADRGWIEDMRSSYGEDHPVWRVRVLGQFNADDEHVLLPSAWLDRCSAPHVPSGPVWIAVDLSAGTGQGDLCALVVRDDDGVLAWEASPSWNYPEEVACKVAHYFGKFGVHPARVTWDAGGLGAGFAYALRMHGIVGARGYVGAAGGCNFATNFRGAAACAFRDRLNPSLHPQPFSIPADLLSRLRPEVRELRYTLAGRDLIKLEPKSEMKKRLGRSPDLLDSIIQSWAW